MWTRQRYDSDERANNEFSEENVIIISITKQNHLIKMVI